MGLSFFSQIRSFLSKGDMEIHSLFTSFVVHFLFHIQFFPGTKAFEAINYIWQFFMLCFSRVQRQSMYLLKFHIELISIYLQLVYQNIFDKVSAAILEDLFFGKLIPEAIMHEHLKYCLSHSIFIAEKFAQEKILFW